MTQWVKKNWATLMIPETTKKDVVKAVEHTVRLLSDLGFKISVSKTLCKIRRLIFLEFHVDTTQRAIIMADCKSYTNQVMSSCEECIQIGH